MGSKNYQYDLLSGMFEKLQNEEDQKLQSDASFKALIKSYTAESVFREIGGSLVNGNYHQIQGYL